VVLGQTLTLSLTARDAEAPPQVLSYSLVGLVPEGAALGLNTGCSRGRRRRSGVEQQLLHGTGERQRGAESERGAEFVVWVVMPRRRRSVGRRQRGIDDRVGTVAGRHYRVEYKDDLGQAEWVVLEENLVGTGAA